MSNPPRRSSSPIQKPSRPPSRKLSKAASFPYTPYPTDSYFIPLHPASLPVSPTSCFTDDNALEKLLSTSLPSLQSHPASPFSTRPTGAPRSPDTSEVTQDIFKLPDSIADIIPNSITTNMQPVPMIEETSARETAAGPSRPPSRRRSNENNGNRNSRIRGRPSRQSSDANTRRRTGENPNLQCRICRNFYSRPDNLRAHMRVHTGDTPYQCRFCAQQFRWMGALRNHEANHERDGHALLDPPPPRACQPSANRRGAARGGTARGGRASAASSPASAASRQFAANDDELAQASVPQLMGDPEVHVGFGGNCYDDDACGSNVLVTEGEHGDSQFYAESFPDCQVLDDWAGDRPRD